MRPRPPRTPRDPARRAALVALSTLLITVSAACRSDGRELRPPTAPLPTPTTTTLAPGATAVPFTAAPLTLPAAPLTLLAPWQDGAAVPVHHTCDEADVSPALTWTNLPEGTVEVALTMVDIDADFVHWAVVGIDLDVTGTVEGAIPDGSRALTNDFGEPGWAGPCPPVGELAHYYQFTVHALNQQLEVADDATAADVIQLLNQNAIEQSAISGTYARAG